MEVKKDNTKRRLPIAKTIVQPARRLNFLHKVLNSLLYFIL
jgi:hypothetical protein